MQVFPGQFNTSFFFWVDHHQRRDGKEQNIFSFFDLNNLFEFFSGQEGHKLTNKSICKIDEG
jgi:hypothetical protein